MRIDVLTLFPEMFTPLVSTSIVGRAVQRGLVEITRTNYRDYSSDAHCSVDDKPFGGGGGMVLMCGPVFAAVEAVTGDGQPEPLKILLTPQGERLNQALVAELAAHPRLMLLCGHYEGFDERIRTELADRQISIGDYVLSGGEPAAMVLIDAIVRLLPGALGDAEASQQDSFSDGMLEYPHYTRPREFRGLRVPEVLLSGHHREIEDWRRRQALRRTQTRRPDLLNPNGAGAGGPDVGAVPAGPQGRPGLHAS